MDVRAEARISIGGVGWWALYGPTTLFLGNAYTAAEEFPISMD